MSTTKKTVAGITVASMMLFSLFFGAGNLIFPPILGEEAGTNFKPAISGFIVGAVLLPVLSIIAIAVTGKGIRQLSERGGRIFGFLFPIAVYLSLGAFYAIPRTAAVSYSAAVPSQWQQEPWTVAVFSLIFFAITLFLAFDPSGMVDRIGKYLTPLLIVLLTIMIVMSVTKLNGTPGTPVNDYATHPLAKGLITGYLTMDSLTALAFGLVLVNILRGLNITQGPRLVGTAALSALIAGGLLAIVYVGLGIIGQKMPGAANYSDGALMLRASSELTLGALGPILFGTIVLLACLGTAAGLLGATSDFFADTFPQLNYRQWAIAFTGISFFISINGLDTVLTIAAPIIGFLYPAAITLVALTLIEPLFKRKLYYTYRAALVVAVTWAAMSTIRDLGFDAFNPILQLSPMDSMDLGWLLPTAIAALLGFIADVLWRPVRAVPVGGEPQLVAELRTGNSDSDAFKEALEEQTSNHKRSSKDEHERLVENREALEASREDAKNHIATLVLAQKQGHDQSDLLHETEQEAQHRLNELNKEYATALQNEAASLEKSAQETRDAAQKLLDQAQAVLSYQEFVPNLAKRQAELQAEREAQEEAAQEHSE